MPTDYNVMSANAPGDVQSILDFFTAEATPGIRRLTRDEVERMLGGQGRFCVMRSTVDYGIVATTYLSQERAQNGKREFEIGGGLVARRLYRLGLMKCLGLCLIAAQRIEEQYDRAHAFRVPKIVGKVECSNPSGIRDLLTQVGFKKMGSTRIRPNRRPGMQHMPLDENGRVCVERFEFDDASLAGCLQQVLQYRRSNELRPGIPERVGIEVDNLKADETGDPLQEVLNELLGLTTPAPTKRRSRRRKR